MKPLSSISPSIEEFLNRLVAEIPPIDATTPVPTEQVLFYFTANAQQQYAVQYDGWVVGVQGSTGNLGVALNADLPASTISVASVYSGSGFIVAPTATGGGQINIPFKVPIKTGDLIKARNYNGGTNLCIVLLGRKVT
jgi:hypothetical protein